jgi:hypothetical protein
MAEAKTLSPDILLQIAESLNLPLHSLIAVVTRHSNRGKCTVRPSYCSQIAEFSACLYSNRGQSGWERTPHKGSREEV